ncbi:MAG: hypothetical protein EP343_19370 [Deltaproteobacteria bacterium]|nr:MAG: hypothetical protein EP343_19370 [Deltaproteobacteria bacterium]
MKESLQTTRCLLLVIGLCVVSLWGCDRTGQRLEENPPPNPLVTKKVKGTEGHLLSGSKKALVRSAHLSAADAAKILKGFSYTAKANYVYKKGEKTLKLRETIQMEQMATGAYRLKVTNNRQKGYEVVWTNKTLYQKMRNRPFRVISNDIDDAYRWQQRAIGRWRSIVGIFGKYLALTQGGGTNLAGRSCYKYQIAMTKEVQDMPKTPEGTAWAGKVPDHTRGDAAKKPRLPESARGTLWVDQETGLPLKVVFKGRYTIGGSKEKMSATLNLEATYKRPTSSSIAPPAKVVAVNREVDAYDPFQRKKPGFLLPPPEDKKAGKTKTRKRRRRRRRRRNQ